MTPSESSVVKKVAYEPLFLSHLRDSMSDQAACAAWSCTSRFPTCGRSSSCSSRAARRAPRCGAALHGAATLRADCGKIVIAVSEDIDPESTDAVFWSLAYRSNPIEDVRDRAVPPRRAGLAVRPGPVRIDDADRRHAEIPDGAARAADHASTWRGARAIWDELKLPALTPKSPWHGYTLGDWTDTWERFARRATAGEWEQNGIETLARQRGATSTPETPVEQGSRSSDSRTAM